MSETEPPVISRGRLDDGREWTLHAAGHAADLQWFLEVDDTERHGSGAHGARGGPALGGRSLHLSGSGPTAGDQMVWTVLADDNADRVQLLVTGGALEMAPIPQDAVDGVRFFLAEAPRAEVVGAIARSDTDDLVAETRVRP
jgi:hypothetical protein